METDGESKLEKSVEAGHRSFLSFHGNLNSTMIERNPQKRSIKLKFIPKPPGPRAISSSELLKPHDFTMACN